MTNRFSQEYLEKFNSDKHFYTSEHREVIQQLFEKCKNGGKLTLAEQQKLGRFIEVSIPVNPDEDDNLNIQEFDCCNDYEFKGLFLTYNNNYNGVFEARNVYGIIPPSQKQADIKRLNFLYGDWSEKITKFTHKDQLLNLVASEANKEIKEIKKIYVYPNYGANVQLAKIKATGMHSKYIYLTIKQFFEEHNSENVQVPFNNETILIDQKSLVHIMFRHYAGVVKQIDTGKSFHLDREINVFKLPYELESILNKIEASKLLVGLTEPSIYFNFRDTVYAIWFKTEKISKKGLGQFAVKRLSTFYPVTNESDMDMLNQSYDLKKIDNILSLFVPKST